MKELDFDELDRAVSSLMGKVPTDDTKPETETVDETPDIAADSAPTEDVAKVVDEPISEPSEPAAEPAKIVTRSRGRFMDIVPGSSSRPSKESQSASSGSGEKPVIKPSAKFEESVLSDQHTVADSDQDDKTENITSDETSETSNPLEDIATPFLTNAKVEKRPLGSDNSEVNENTAVAEMATDDTSSNEPSQTELTEHNDDVEAQQASVNTQMPAELASDVVSVETGGALLDKEGEKTDLDGDDLLPDIDIPSSIPQQYQTSKTKQDQPEATLYGTQHEITIPKNRHTGLWILLVIILCIAIGVGGGYLAYSMHLLG